MSLGTYLPAVLWSGVFLWIPTCAVVGAISADDGATVCFRRIMAVTILFMAFFGGFAIYGIEKWSA